MVVVSDDVHEYAVALKDTEEKIARCPARVSQRADVSAVTRLKVNWLHKHLQTSEGQSRQTNGFVGCRVWQGPSSWQGLPVTWETEGQGPGQTEVSLFSKLYLFTIGNKLTSLMYKPTSVEQNNIPETVQELTEQLLPVSLSHGSSLPHPFRRPAAGLSSFFWRNEHRWVIFIFRADSCLRSRHHQSPVLPISTD